jgi:hypothetical protein
MKTFVATQEQCSKIRWNYENRTSSIPLVFEKIDKNRPKRTGDDGGTAKTENTDKSAGFSENRCGNFRADFAQNWPFFYQKSVN